MTEERKLKSLLAEVEAGNYDAAWELVERYGPHIKAVVRRRMNPQMRRAHDSDDFVQQVWASFIRIRPRLRDLENSRQLVGLLAKIASNTVVDEVRRAQRTPGPPPPHFPQKSGAFFEPDQLPNRQPAPSQYLIAKERFAELVNGMPAPHRRIVELRFGGAKYQEIADQVGVSERTVRRVLYRALGVQGDTPVEGEE